MHFKRCNSVQRVAKLYGQGRLYKGIGLLLDIYPATVRNFLGRVYTKLDISNKVELVSLLSIVVISKASSACSLWHRPSFITPNWVLLSGQWRLSQDGR